MALMFGAVLLGAVSGGWSYFLWRQLIVARSGGEPFCALGGGGCAALWDDGFATAVQSLTGVPVAGWGLAWSLVAVALPLWAWRGRAGARSTEVAWAATVANAVGGLLAVALLGGVSLWAGAVCTNCLITYAIVIAYALLIFAQARSNLPSRLADGAAGAIVATGIAYAALLYPGLATPPAGAALGGAALPTETADDAAPDLDPIRTMVESLTPEQRQLLANVRAEWMAGEPARERPLRALWGSIAAPVRLTTFTDSSCGHCASFHEGLLGMLRAVPPDSVAVEQRMFPLDGSCNPVVPATGHPERCLAAKVRICLEHDPRAFQLTGWLHEAGGDLSEDRIYATASTLKVRSDLERCVATEETTQLLNEDIGLAVESGIQGTPFVLLNGRPTTPYLPFFYAMAVTGGDPEPPALADLPQPELSADPHAGHDHAEHADAPSED